MADVRVDGSANQTSGPSSGPRSGGGMVTAMSLVQALIGIAGIVLIVLGFGFWGGRWTDLVPIHEKLGMLLVLLLWVVALIGLAYKVSKVRIAIAIVWGFITIGFGFAQPAIMTGGMHWVIRVLHLIVGIIALVLAAQIAAGISATARARR